MDKMFEKYRKRLMWNGILNSIMLSFAMAFISMGIVAVITLIVKISTPLTLALIFGIGGGIFLTAVLPLYFIFFRPTDKMVAKRLDLLGLDERYITMLECSEDNSTMAELQRKDAQNKLAGISAKCLKFTLALPIIILLTFGVIFAAGTTTASIFTANVSGSLGGNNETPPEPITLFTIQYFVYEDGTGTIDGQSTQKVQSGQYTQKVKAVAAEGYQFVAWVDENKNYLANQNNPRNELNVQQDMTIYALFEKIDEEEKDDDVDNETSRGDDESTDQNPSGGGQGQGGGSTGDDGKESENNNVIDGTCDYKENFDREQHEKDLVEKDLPDDLKDILGDYYQTLKP